jgi:hypothetical protein
MNDQKQPSPPPGNDDAEPPQIMADPADADSTVVFAGDPTQVSAGFALALRLMGFEVPEAEPSPDDQAGRKQ